MPRAAAEGCALEYDTVGPDSGEPLVVVQGLGDQLTKWDDGFPQALAARGFFVIRFDNRDAGLSTHFPDAGIPDLGAVSAGSAELPYCLEDMAADVVAVLDAVGVDRAHLVGASMGGMIAQLVAADHPHRTRSLTSIMSSTGNPALPPPTPEAITALTAPAPDPSNEEVYLNHVAAAAQALGSPAYPYDEAELRATILSTVHRDHDPAGLQRQLAALLANGDRRAKLRRITAPTLVIHGADDPLIPPAAAEDTASTIPGAELLVIPGMGHNLPRELYDRVADAIARLAATPA
ncbi:alpha/beta fold hydrolase [Amycolatopsis sp. DSM 110486]|uniref:alpha/beta fold hydrolase n=1 Tax=Amycolatopsis sp. DSM 110486 TaxID=2865832 RepID=UPI001C69BADA|nr:alpha/beta hydrolase [Amycolatopsis sp. DSM 110486]QYN22039.1 alpha/beta fold hydrolase [Amycolatopsis sp. DSM 110486]